MKLELDGAELHDTLRAAIYEPRSTLPILGYALLDASGERVRITTTDTEAYFIAELAAKVPASGSICVKIDMLKAAAREGKLALAHNDGSSIMQASPKGGSKLRLPVLDGEQFPTPDQLQWVPIEADPLELADAIRTVKYAVGRGDVRAWINCVGVTRSGVAATNSHRVALYRMPYAGPQMAIPEAHVEAVLGMLGADARLSCSANDAGNVSMLRIERGGRTLIVRMIDGQLPPYTTLFDGTEQRERRALFDRAKLLQAVKQFLPFTAQEGIPKAAIKGAFLVVSDGAAKLECGDNEENCSWALGKHEGEIRFSLSMPYLADVLAAIDTDKVWIGVARKGAAVKMERLTIEPEIAGADVPPHAHIIVGMRL